ncbi:MAG: YbhB/YbcL family Raf kinase inhibitor-like protein [Ilumatobacteraceae bacterium]
MSAPRAARAALIAVPVLAAVLLAACDTDDGKDLRVPTSEQRAAQPTTTTTTTTTLAPGVAGGLPGGSALPATAPLASVAPVAPFTLQLPWASGGVIDVRFTCDGADRSPLLIWSAPPAGTVEMALLVTDDSADGFVHWAVAAIPPTAGEVGEGGEITGAFAGRNDTGEPGWSGPCPPAGAPHTYRFTLYALGQQAELPDDFTGADLLGVAGPSSIGLAESTGVYTRAG